MKVVAGHEGRPMDDSGEQVESTSTSVRTREYDYHNSPAPREVMMRHEQIEVHVSEDHTALLGSPSVAD